MHKFFLKIIRSCNFKRLEITSISLSQASLGFYHVIEKMKINDALSFMVKVTFLSRCHEAGGVDEVCDPSL